MEAFGVLDGVAVVWFFGCWIAYGVFADRTRFTRNSVSARMNTYRRQWMENMVRRELRMIDTMIHGTLLNGVAFFASTSILLVGGLLAVVGATEQAIEVLSDLPFVTSVSRLAWEAKVLLMVMIFIYAFFKFAWSYRLFNYCSILIGAAPLETDGNPVADAHAHRIADLHGLAGGHFNGGVRAYFFALAALGWFLHPAVFILATAWVAYVVYRREFRSRSYDLLADHD